ncbi:MAG TPA: hypothetical protein VFV94_16570 [Polyangiaceae bacterium]|nr:hypothetical protein [Polyangiaceae bacterium]
MQHSKTKRRTRPEPERTEPNRAFRTAPNGAGKSPNGAATPPNGVGKSPNGAGKSPNGAATPDGAATPPNGASESAPNGESTRSSAFRALNDAYRLVDEYLRQGQEMAENIWLPFGENGMPGWPSPGAPERFMRSLGDMTLAWVEVVQQWTNAQAAPQRPPNGSAGPFEAASTAERKAPAPPSAADAHAEPGPRRELGVSVEAKGRVEVSVDLAGSASSDELEAGWLQPAKGKAAPITSVSLRVDGKKLVVHIVVPEKQPRGTYNGLLLDSRSLKARGTVSVVVR